jgi:hypothetical protein
MTRSSTGVRQLTDITHLKNKAHTNAIGRFALASGGVDNGLVAEINFSI